MRYLKEYKVFERSEFVDIEDVNKLLDKINDSGIESLTDIDKNNFKLFSDGDKEIIDTIEQMGDITNQFKELNTKMREVSNSDKDGEYLMKTWSDLNNKLRPLEQSFSKWGIQLGDPRLTKLMKTQRPDVYNNLSL